VTFVGDNDFLRQSDNKVLVVFSSPSPRVEPFFKSIFDNEKTLKFLLGRKKTMFIALQWAKADLDPVQWGECLPMDKPRASLPFNAVPQFDVGLVSTKVAMQEIAEFLRK
jgi:hypothetical protein